MTDTHYLGEYQTLSDVWKKFPNGGGYGDYVTILGVRHDWNETTSSWGDDPGDVDPALPEVVNHDIDVQGTVTARDGIKTADYIPGEAGAFIDHAGDAEFRSVNVDALWVKDPVTGEQMSLPDFIKVFKTELPPDWAEYEQITQFDNVRILAFDPLSQDKFYTTIGALKKLISDSIAAGSTGGGTFEIEVLRSDAPEGIPTDNNVFSSLKTLLAIQDAISTLAGKYISKVTDDIAQGLITFQKGIKARGLSESDSLKVLEDLAAENGATFGNYITGLLGEGAKIYKSGHGEFDSLFIRKFLEVPELRYNRVSVYTGVRWDTFGAGIIESVVIDKDVNGNDLNTGVITLKLEEGEFGAISEDDLCQGIFHNFTGTNDTVNEDQRNGNFRFKGFNTVYFRVIEILDTSNNGVFRYQLRPESDNWYQQHHPQAFMHFAAYANPSDTSRQACVYTTTEYTIRLDNMTSWEYGEANIYGISGKLEGFKMGETIFQGHGNVIGNAYIYGHLQGIEEIIREQIQVGGKNLLREHALQFAGKYWGGDAEWKDIDIDTLINILAAENDKIVVTENNLLIEY